LKEKVVEKIDVNVYPFIYLVLVRQYRSDDWFINSRIWGSHGGEYEDGRSKLLPDYTALQPRRQPSSIIK
jgi:hypothetical protein